MRRIPEGFICCGEGGVAVEERGSPSGGRGPLGGGAGEEGRFVACTGRIRPLALTGRDLLGSL